MNDEPSAQLIAPCGMNCALCSRYLAYQNDLKRSHCKGCRVENHKCTYLFAKCDGINHGSDGTSDAAFCFECDQYPCKQIQRMDDRYRKNYHMSVMTNLAHIQEVGTARFLEEQRSTHSCPKCGALISVHNGKCFRCDTVTKLVEKR